MHQSGREEKSPHHVATPRAAAGKNRNDRSPSASDASADEQLAHDQFADEIFDDGGPGWLADFIRDSPSWLTSLVVHTVLLLVLALWMLPGPVREIYSQLSIDPRDAQSEEPLEELTPDRVEELDVDVAELTQVEPQPEAESAIEPPDFSPADVFAATSVQTGISEMEPLTARPGDLMTQCPNLALSDFASRRGDKRRRDLSTARGMSGMTPASENAVALALQWFARHQNADGSWSLDHRKGACQGRCGDPGGKTSQIGATALALLPFLGAGQTHEEGKFKKTVAAGLYYLASHMKLGPQGGDLRDEGGNMYAHGLASIALCEAYAMTQDRGLAGPAQQSLNFIVSAQDPVGGGWRYKPRQAGDTSVVGWQLMALKSGRMAYLNVPANTFKGVSKFLDSVQTDSGAAYGYATPGNGPATSAVGLLCRMYGGWKNDNPALERGVQRFAKAGPLPTNFYSNYYATQVMFQYTAGEGEMWKKWNAKMRDQLVGSQAQEGHARGSWFAGNDHSSKSGGRHYCTAMATMMLEIYYRHMPIYKHAAVAEEFPE